MKQNESSQQTPNLRQGPSGTTQQNVTDSEVSQAFYPPNFKSTEKRQKDSIELSSRGGNKLKLEPQPLTQQLQERPGEITSEQQALVHNMVENLNNVQFGLDQDEDNGR